MNGGQRTTLIGGSEAAAACGLDPFKSPVRLWLEKTGQIEPSEAGEAAKWGTILQPIIAAEVERGGYAVLPAPDDALQHEDYPFMSGHPDGYCTWDLVDDAHHEYDAPTRGVLEIKTAGIRMAQLWNDDATPPQYVLQAMHYLVLTGLDWALVACLIGGQRLEVRRLERDEHLIALMLELEAQFWQHVTEGTAPPPDGSKATDEALKRLYPSSSGEVVHLTADDYQRVEEYRRLRTQLKKVETQLTTIEQEFKVRLGRAETGIYEARRVVRWPEIETRRISQARLKEEYPQVAEAVTEPSVYRRFVIT